MAESRIWTFRDVVEYLVDALDVPLSARNQRVARQAVIAAYRDLPNRYRWKALERRATILTTASQTSSTITYDHTGGTYERKLTLATGTWPTDAAEGKVVISDVPYKIATRESSTVVTLDSRNNPGADVAAGTSYTWYRSTYALPVDFRKICHIYNTSSEDELRVVTSDTLHSSSVQFYSSAGTPCIATIRGTGDYYNSMSIEFSPPPSTAITYDYMYEAMPRQLNIEKYTTGTVSCTNGLFAVTGGSTVFPTDCVGAIIRFSSNGTTEPTSLIGGYDSASTWNDNRYADQRVIMSRSSDTALTIDATVSATRTSVKYTISDPIDLDESAMFTAFLRLAEAELARMVSHEKLRNKQMDARQAVIEAMEADQRATYSHGTVAYSRFTDVTITDDDS